jgi:hypothetical protein
MTREMAGDMEKNMKNLEKSEDKKRKKWTMMV